MNYRKYQFFGFLFLILLGSSIPSSSMPKFVILTWDKIFHIIEYTIAGFLGYRAYHQDLKNPIIRVSTFCIIFCIIDEIWQSMIPGRFPSHYDIIADVIGVIFGITICIFFINKTQ